MSLWIKICANTSLEDALLAADAGADALGFVFAPSPRHVTLEQVAAIVPKLPDSVEKIGVFVEATLDEIAATVVAVNLTGVQLQFDASESIRSGLRARFGANLRILQALHFDTDVLVRAAKYAQDINIDALLVDSRTSTAPGGTGIAFDWKSAATMLFQDPRHGKMVAAGGLSPDNVQDAIAILKPWGVDVVTGVEASVGRKDPAKVRDFVARARAASLQSLPAR
jgi:phosphoribosylanthranilate isomerase